MPSPEPGFDQGLLSPATAGSDEVVSDSAILRALVETEVAYLLALVDTGIAPTAAGEQLDGLDLGTSAAELAMRARDGGNPIIPLVSDLRALLAATNPDAAAWVHRGATSQDVLDSALMLAAHRARELTLTLLDRSIAALATLADEHRDTIAAARTLTQHSTPTTVGLRFATWLTAMLDARDALAGVVLPAELGGASGTLASLVEIAGAERASAMPAAFAARLGLAAPPSPWHVTRSPVTRLGDALVTVTDALGMIAANVATLSRTEIAEVAEPAAEGRGGSSAMPQKRNPVFSVLIRSVVLRAPGLAMTLHTAASAAVDERPDGAWHAEWSTLRELLRITVGAAARMDDLTSGLTVDSDRVAANLRLTGDDILSERHALTGVTGSPGEYVGLAGSFIDSAIERARS